VVVSWGLVLRAFHIHDKVFVGSGDNIMHVVLTSSIGKPTPEPLVSNKATIMADMPEGAVIGAVISIG